MKDRSVGPGSWGRMYTVLAAVAAVAVVLSISACGSDSEGSGGGGGGGGGGGDKSAKQEKVVALLSGTTEDGGFSEGFWNGVQKSKEKNPGMTIRDSGPIESADAMVRQ